MVARVWPLILILLPSCLPTGRSGDSTAPALESGVVAPPRLVQPSSPTRERAIRVVGYATPGHRIELYVNSVLEGQTVTDSEGRFQLASIPLRTGLNIITAVAVDAFGNRSEARPAGGGAREGMESQLGPEVRVVVQE